MKKLLLIAMGAVLVLAFAASAQETTEGGKISFGLKAGLGLANVTGDSAKADPGETKKSLLGFGGGATFHYQLAPTFAFQLEALYMMKGVKYKLDASDTTFKFVATYLEIPATFHFTPKTSGKIAPTLFAGPYLGILLSSKLKATGYSDVDWKDSTNSTDFGITFGGGFNYALTRGAITFDIRYDLGMSKIPKKGADGSQDDTKTTGIYAMLGYRFSN